MKFKKTSELSYFLGIIICALGVTFNAKSGFGVSMVVAPAYVIHCKLVEIFPWFTFGVSEIIFQGLLILLVAIIMKKFKLKYLFSIFTIFFYSVVIDGWRLIFGTEIPDDITTKIIFEVIGILLVAFAIALLLRTYLPQQAYELVVKEITTKTSKNMNMIKWIYDISSLVFAIVLMLILFRKFSFDMVGPGTIIIAVVNAPLITLFGKLLDSISPFEPKFQNFKNWYDSKLN